MNRSTLSLCALCTATLVALAGCDKPPSEPLAPEGDAAVDESVAAEEAAPDTVALAPGEGASAPAGTDDASTESVVAPDGPAVASDATSAAPDEEATPTVGAALPTDTLGDEATLEALISDSEIPYPIYPNGVRYRVGGENGLRIVLFETGDSFEEVDTFYRDRTEAASMPRLEGMDDYVRYARAGDDGADDPWATHRPGIVIHRFRDDEERAAVGADDDARTNIIVSF